MKKLLKNVSVFLVVLMVVQLLPLTTMAKEYNEELAREEYLRETLSNYLYDLVDTKDITEILQPEPYISQDNPYGTVLTLKNKKGENVSYIFSEPVAFFDAEGKMQYKEIAIERQRDAKAKDAGYAYSNGTNDYRINFAEAASAGIQVQKDSVSWKLSVNKVSKNITGKILNEKTDNKTVGVFSYENAFGRDTILKYYPQLNGVKEDIVLNSYSGVNEFSFSLVVENGYAVLNTDNTVTIHNKTTGKIVDTFTPPYAYDSIEKEDENSPAQHYVDCEYGLKEVGEGAYLFSITVPKAFLEAKTTVYPVIIDPTTSSIYQSMDTPVYSGYPTSSYSSNVMNCFGRASGYGYGRVLTKFTIPTAIKNYATISSAYLWVRELTGRTGTTYVRPYMNTSAFTGSSTWNTKPSYDTNTSMSNKNINSNSQDGGPSVYWYKFDIAYAVRKWTTGTANNGLSFISNEESNGAYNWRGFASAEHGTSSYRPYAVITYTNDTTAPTISSVTGNPTSWTKNNVTLTVNATDNASGVKYYSFDNGSTWQTGNTKSFSSNQTVYVKVKDNAGNVSSASTVVISKIDKTNPSITNVAQNPSNWTNGNITLTVNATDNASGVANYSFDNGSTWQTGNTKSFSSNQTVYVKVKDTAGNISSATTVAISKIDKTAPTITSVTGNPTSWTNQNVTLSVNASDNASGIAAYSFDNGSTWQSAGSKTFSANQTVNIKVKDNAGNISAPKPITITKIDKTIPQITSVAKSTANWTNGNITLTVTATDNASGVAYYSFDGKTTWQTGNTKTISSSATYQIYVKDAAGNISNVYSEQVSNIDKTAPTITSVSGNPTSWTNQNVTLTVNATDAASGIAAYSFDNGATWQTAGSKTFSANQTVNIKVKDNANNIAIADPIYITKIDKTIASADEISVSRSPEGWTNQDVTLTVSAEDAGSGIAAYSFDNGVTWQTASSKTFGANQTVNIKVKDNAGNISACRAEIIDNIDRTAPGAPAAFVSGDLLEMYRFSAENEEAEEHIEYRLNNSELWKTYTIPIRMVCTSETVIHSRTVDEAGNVTTGPDVYMAANVGIYTSVKDDLRNGDFMLPSGFIRTYHGNTDEWFFAFNANIQSECGGKALKFTDFSGDSSYYIQHSNSNRYYNQAHKKIVMESGTVQIGEHTVPYLYYCKYNDATLYFNAAGQLSAMKNGDQKVQYEWSASELVASDIFGRSYTVVFTNGNPVTITDCANHTVTYAWNNGKLTAAANALNYTETYSYDADGRLIQNGSEAISYTADGRTAQITQQNGSFLKYTYDDSYSYYDWILFNRVHKYGKVQIADSRGVYTYVKYADGFVVGEALDANAETSEYAGTFAEIPQMQSDLSGTTFLNAKNILAIFNLLYTIEIPIKLLDDTHYVFYNYDEDDNVTGAAIVAFEEDDDLAESYEQALSFAENSIQNTYTNGLLTESIYLEKVNDSWGYVSKDTYTYNSFGQILTHAEYVIKDGAWAWESYRAYTYDAYGYYDITAIYEPPANLTNYVPGDPAASEKLLVEHRETTYNSIGNLLSESFTGADSQYENSFVYDALGRVVSATRDAETILYTYDAADRVLTQTQGEDVNTFVYTNGNLTSYTSSLGDTTAYTYDVYGNLSVQEFDIYALTYNTLGSLLAAEVNANEIVNYEYTGTSQNVTKEAYANNQEVNYIYTDGRLTSVWLGALDDDNNVTQTVVSEQLGNNATGYIKTETGSLTSVSSGNAFLYSVENKNLDEEDETSFNGKIYTIGNTEYTLVAEENADTFIRDHSEYEKTYTYTDDKLTGVGFTGIFSSAYAYGNNDSVTSLTHSLNGLSKGYLYTYDTNGNITSETQTVTQNNSTSSEAVNYSYDGQSRLVAAENDSVKWTYSYDNRGNILSKAEYAVSLGQNNEKVYTLVETDTFSYANSAWPDELTSFNNQVITYDAAGNPTSYKGNPLTWTMGRQLASYGNTTYTYNEAGIRTRKTANNVTTQYYLDGTNIIAQTDGTNTVFFRYDSNDEIVGLTYLGADYFYVKNQMGDITGISDTNGNLVAEYEYDPWGAVISVTGSNIALANANPFRYRSYYYDTDTGMYYLQSRYYDPELCRFINADDIQYVIGGYCLFIYCINNPVIQKDPTGTYTATQFWNFVNKFYIVKRGAAFAGFGWDYNQGIWYSLMNPIQRKYGYCDTYDNAAPFIGIFIKHQKIPFEYNGKTWMIWLWKGQYGITTGAEIGLYIDPGLFILKDEKTWYRCANDSERIIMSFTLYKNGKKLFQRPSQTHWWLTGFKPGLNVGATGLTMQISLTFHNVQMADSFYRSALKRSALKNVIRNNRTVSFVW